jgi:hypothetical protein
MKKRIDAEDIFLVDIAEKRESTLDVKKALSHEDTWSY